MSHKKSIPRKNLQDQSIIDSIFWFIENYLPQKKKRSLHEEFRPGNFESFTIQKIKNFASSRFKSLRGDLNHTKITFTVGNWALPYLYFLKKIKILK